MKKITLILVVMLVAGAGMVQAAGNKTIDKKILRAFENQFSLATQVNWDVIEEKGLYHASFTFNNERVEAFFNEDGELLSTARFISEQQLPIMVINKLATEYKDYEVTQVIEFATGNDINYLVSAGNTAETLSLKFTAGGDLLRHKKMKNKN